MERGSIEVTRVVFLGEPSNPFSLPEANVEQWDIEDHPVNLADHILGVIETIQKSYLAI